MPSERKLIANRKNARSSTGPRTATGKMRSARNAYRHGLSVSALTDPAFAPGLEQFAIEIAGQGAPARLQALAMAIAAAQIDLVRVRQARQQLLGRAACNSYSVEVKNPRSKADNGAALASTLADIAQQLIAIDRYERRALSRRKLAIRAFDIFRANPGACLDR